MIKRQWIGLFIGTTLLLSLAATPSSAADCNDNLLDTTWQCTLRNVDNQNSTDFNLSFFNQSIAQIDIPSMGFQASGPFACEMRPRFFGRRLVSGRSFLASLMSYINGMTVTLTGDSYRHWILNGNGLNSTGSGKFYYLPTVVYQTTTTTQVQTNWTIQQQPSNFVYKCNNPTSNDK